MNLNMPQGTQPRKILLIKSQWKTKSDHSHLESKAEQLRSNRDSSCGHAHQNLFTARQWGRGPSAPSPWEPLTIMGET